MTHKTDKKRIEQLVAQLESLRSGMIDAAQRYVGTCGEAHSVHAESQRNLLHYLELRRHDLRPLQQELAMLGLSSLGRAESHVLASLDAVLMALSSLGGNDVKSAVTDMQSGGFRAGCRLLETHSQKLLGPDPPRRSVRIMVTIPSEAESDYTLIHSLVWQGMDVARINCAHDSPEVWERMINHIRRAQKAQGRSCRILMDLAGPKLRTGSIEPGPPALKWRPRRDPLGNVVNPARLWITDSDRRTAAPAKPDAVLPVPGDFVSCLRVGDQIRLKDARGSQRRIDIIDVTPDGCWGESNKTAYITPGIKVVRIRSKKKREAAVIRDIDPLPGEINLATDDILVLTRESQAGRPATRDSAGRILTPARIACTLPEVFNDVQTGERVWFDDGKIGGTIEKVEADRIFVRITHARPEGSKLQSDKGINLPDSSLRLPALTQKDLQDLEFIAAHADMVGLSFAQGASDVELLIKQLNRLQRSDMGIVLKIETRRGFDQLPAMLLAGMKSSSLGVMIARGDLAVESGFERMAEVQEEILWICEAAHCPVIWATQVLETLAKQGMASRAEITDAAMGHRAEAVMLNKGPHILRAVQMLDDILQRMEAHQMKKQSMMRELHLARSFMTALPAEIPSSAKAG
jgi:pyruvate kinase